MGIFRQVNESLKILQELQKRSAALGVQISDMRDEADEEREAMLLKQKKQEKLLNDLISRQKKQENWSEIFQNGESEILKSLEGINITDAQLLIRELPNLLRLPYPAVKDLRKTTLQIISLMKNIYHLNYMWKDYIEMDYISDLLKE